jgi:hypothetical protein
MIACGCSIAFYYFRLYLKTTGGIKWLTLLSTGIRNVNVLPDPLKE